MTVRRDGFSIIRLDLRRFLACLFVFALAIRLVAVGGLRDWRQGPSPRHGADGIEFDSLGSHLANRFEYSLDGQHPTSFRAPGFPGYLAVLYQIFGKNYPLMRASFCFLGALGVVLTSLLAGQLVDERRARWSGVLAAMYPPHVLFATRFDSENLFVPLLGLALWLAIRQLRQPSGVGGGLVGFTLGLAALTRPFALLLFPVFFLVMVLARDRPRLLRFRGVAALTLIFLATVGIWTYRNYRVYGRFVAIATNGGSTFYGGNNSLVAGRVWLLGSWVSTTELPGRKEIEETPDEVAHDKLEWKLGLAWVEEHPSLLPKLLVAKSVRYWIPDFDSPNKYYILFIVVSCAPFIMLYTVGAFRAWTDRLYRASPWLLIHGVFLATYVTALVFWGSPRFRDSIAPVLMVYAVVPRKTRRSSVDEPEILLQNPGDFEVSSVRPGVFADPGR